MARPQTDIEAGRRLLLETVESMVKQRGATDISMAELATQAGMSPSNIYRFFESKEAMLEAVAEEWFADKVEIMERVSASEMPAQQKMLAFFGQRFAMMQVRYDEDPDLFKSYCTLGMQYFDVVRGYVDLGDHYLAIIVAEAMDEGHFAGLSIDQCVSIINQMIQPYCNPDMLATMGHLLSQDKLAIIINTIFAGLNAGQVSEASEGKSAIKLVS